MMTSTGKFSNGPLDTLVLTQLNELRRAEEELVRRYASISEEDNAQIAFASEVTQLQRRADRLHRMLEGMSIHSTLGVTGRFVPAVA
jgi:hypothetical protein